MADVGWSKGGSGQVERRWESGKVAGQLQELQGSAQATNDLFKHKESTACTRLLIRRLLNQRQQRAVSEL